MNIFILEDNEERIKIFNKYFIDHNIFTANSVNSAKEVIKKNKKWDVIFLDHDLGGQIYVNSYEENTGYRFAQYIKENKIKYNQLIIHSMNIAGANNIKSILKDGLIVPFFRLFQ